MAPVCPSCGERLPRRAAHCPRCGASTAVLAVDDAHEPFVGDPVVTMGASGRGRRGWLVGAGLVVVLGGGALIAGRTTDNATTAATTTIGAPTTTSTTTARPSTTVARPRPTTTTVAVTTLGGPVLPEPTGESLYTVNTSGDVYRVDLDTGTLTHSLIGRSFQSAAIVAVGDGALVFEQYVSNVTGVDDQTVLYHVHADGSVEPISVDMPSSARLPAPGVGVWVYEAALNATTATLVRPDGTPAATLDLPSGRYNIVPDGDGLVFSSASGIYRTDAQGIRRLATGELIAVSDRYVVASQCDDAFQCTVTRTDRRSGQTDTIGPRPPGLQTIFQSGALNPDGDTIAISIFGDGTAPPGESFYDLATNTIRSAGDERILPAPDRVGWTTTGWAVFVDFDAHVIVQRGTEVHSLDLSPRSTPVALAVGPTPGGAATSEASQ